MQSLYKKFKNVTGFRYADIADRLGVTRQAIDHSLRNYSITQINANKWILAQMIDEAIDQHEEEIRKLRELKTEVTEYRRNCDEN